MIDSQIKEYVSLASQYKIGDIVIAEMGRLNTNQEVRFPGFLAPSYFFRSCRSALDVYVLRVESLLTNLSRLFSANSSPGSKIPS